MIHDTTVILEPQHEAKHFENGLQYRLMILFLLITTNGQAHHLKELCYRFLSHQH
jgi:hypothetical protein